MGSLHNPIATLMSHRAQNILNRPTIMSSAPVPSPSGKLTRRKNYLRPKILKTLNKPQSIPLPPPTSEDPVASIEPSVEVVSEPMSSFQESEALLDENELSLDQLEVVQTLEDDQGVKSFNVISGRTIVRIVASFVGLFILQSVVTVWVLGRGESDEKERSVEIKGQGSDIRLGMRTGGVDLNGNVYLGNWASHDTDRSDMEAKIAEIRKMAREAREAEKKESLKNGEGDVINESDGDGDDELEHSPRIQSGIEKEVDKRLTKMRKRSLEPILNVNYLNMGGDTKESRNKDENQKGEDDMLMFEIKHRFRSHLTAARDKPKGKQTIEGGLGAMEKPRVEQPMQQMAENVNNGNASLVIGNKEINDLVSESPKRNDFPLDEKKPGFEGSSPLKASKKGFGSNGSTKKLNKRHTSSKKSGSKSKELSKRINISAEPDRDSPRKMNDQEASTTSKMHAMSDSKVQPKSDGLGSKLSMNRDDSWWSTLPYILVILMQTGPDDEGQQGFYTIRMYSDSKSQSYTPYIVGFEDRSDARNFSYLLESAFEDLPDASMDVIPLSPKELQEAKELLNKEVIVVKKGRLHLYAGQPLDEVESALRSLVK